MKKHLFSIFSLGFASLSLFVFALTFACKDNTAGSSTTPPSTITKITNQTPVASDYDISELSQTFDGSPKPVTITPKPGKSSGDVTVLYNSSTTTAPSSVGEYSVVFDVAAAPGWDAASDLSAGTLTISVASNASGKAKILAFFDQISGQKTVLAMHNREPNSEPARQTNRIFQVTGKYPAMWSGDFLYQQNDVNARWTMIQECKSQWNNGAIVQLMLHVVNPRANAGGYNNSWDYVPTGTGPRSDLSDAEWTDLITNGGTLNNKWKQHLDNYAQYFQDLKDNGVTVMFRPFHEMNQGQFWWAGRPGPTGTAALYRLTRDYLENVKGLDNIIWIWNMQDLSGYATAWPQYNPGADYWDIFSVDIYEGFTTDKYNQALNVAGNKPVAIGECYVLPTAQRLLQEPKWVFCMSWADGTFDNNTDQQIIALYNAANTLTLDDLPNFRDNTPPAVNHVTNGDFSNVASAWPYLPTGWDTTTSGGDGWSPIKTEDGRFMGWAENTYSFTLSQNITGLTAGTYSLAAEFRLNYDSAVSGVIEMRVYSGANLIKSQNIRSDLFALPTETNHRFELSGVQVTGSTVKIEFAATNVLKYIGIDNVSFSK